MVNWDCNAETLAPLGRNTHSRDVHSITIELKEISPAGVHKAAIVVGFSRSWGNLPNDIIAIGPGEFRSYTDPDGIVWRIHVDDTTYAAGGGSADTRVCFEGAEGEIQSIDVPASAKVGEDVIPAATVTNRGGKQAWFFLRFYEGETIVLQTLAARINPGEVIVNWSEGVVPMPNHAWVGRIEIVRQE